MYPYSGIITVSIILYVAFFALEMFESGFTLMKVNDLFESSGKAWIGFSALARNFLQLDTFGPPSVALRGTFTGQ